MRSYRVIDGLIIAGVIAGLAILFWVVMSAATHVPDVGQYPYVIWPRDNYTVYCEKMDTEKRVGYNCTRSRSQLESFSLGAGDSWAVRK